MGYRVLAAVAVCAVVAGPIRALAGVSFDFLDATGGFGIGRESFDRPVDVVQDREENLYVVDRGNNRIQVLDRRGRFVREWGGRGFSPGSFDAPSAIAIDRAAGVLFVVDTGNHRIQKFDLNGKALLSFGRLGSGTGDFNKPLDVALDRKGNVYVADSGNNRIQKFDSSGKFLVEWGRFARRKGAELNNPVSLAYSEEGFGFVYVLNSPECRVQKYDIEGNLSKEWPMHRKGEGALCGPSRIRIEPRKYTVYIADTENDRVILFDRDGEPLGDLKTGKAGFRKPAGVSVDVTFDENVVVADTGNHLIQKFRRTR
ncbi:MAG: 6-bladed beta-propeller [Deltaproteobacteria bacterium]|nr:6-bladed beta-propeller [Deltaproteobacteria bacterium]